MLAGLAARMCIVSIRSRLHAQSRLELTDDVVGLLQVIVIVVVCAILFRRELESIFLLSGESHLQ